jgi:hypothetical protein
MPLRRTEFIHGARVDTVLRRLEAIPACSSADHRLKGGVKRVRGLSKRSRTRSSANRRAPQPLRDAAIT